MTTAAPLRSSVLDHWTDLFVVKKLRESGAVILGKTT